MQGNEGRLDLWPCRQLGMPGAPGRLERGWQRVTVWVTASGAEGMTTTRIYPHGTGLAAFNLG